MDYATFCKIFTSEVPPATWQGDRAYLVGEDLAGFTSGEQRKPHAVGLALGMGNKDFVPSLALLRILAQSSTKKAVVNDAKAEWRFLCGRDVFAEFFTSNEKAGFVLVQNKHDENLGLGTIVQDERGKTLLKNIVDRGNYLRHEPVTLAGKKARKKDIYRK